MLRAGRLLDAVAAVDEVLLVKGLRLSDRALAAVRSEHADLTARRVSRGKSN